MQTGFAPHIPSSPPSSPPGFSPQSLEPGPSSSSTKYTTQVTNNFHYQHGALTYVILAAGSVACEILYLEHKGDEAVTWSEACGSYGKFCHRATASVAMTFVSVLVYAGLSLISSYRLFTKYDAPVCFHSGKGTENPVFQG